MRYTEEQSPITFLYGILFAVFWFCLIWHKAEAECQTEHNVSDCEIAAVLFVPVVQEEAE